jgi:hypothetical protein
MKAVAARMAGRIKSERLARSLDVLPGDGHQGPLLETDAPYRQKYISIIEISGGKLSLYRESWNPLISRDANGGREAWTAAFGSPEHKDARS